MFNLRPTIYVAMVFGCLAVAGCQTPPTFASKDAALKEANHTAKLMSILDLQLNEFRSVQQSIEKARRDSLENQHQVNAQLDENSAFDWIASAAAGGQSFDAFKKKLIENAEALKILKVKSAADNASYKVKLDSLLSPLPNSSTEITAAQAKAVAMGTPLDQKTRLEELSKFVPNFEDSKVTAEQIIAMEQQGYAYLYNPTHYNTSSLGTFVRAVDTLIKSLQLK